jgi:hypothetical protein
MKLEFRTQFKKSKEGNIHFSFLSVSFGSNAFLIAILGLVFTFKQQEQCKCGQPKVGGYSCQRTDCNQNL